ncbi:MAG: type II toxin-antitoxin system VapC family toxin [Polaromonas sp.]|nr:type II toxin-antitoxin system VapC family toxin [Polaromonas sp.]
MASLDTNVLVRYLVQDDDRQLGLAKKLIRAVLRAGETLYIPITVMLELEWVLRSNFGFDKDQITNAISSLLASAELSFESEAAAEVALALYQRNRADFADCVHVALAHAAGERPLWTFDRAASKLDGAKMLAA